MSELTTNKTETASVQTLLSLDEVVEGIYSRWLDTPWTEIPLDGVLSQDEDVLSAWGVSEQQYADMLDWLNLISSETGITTQTYRQVFQLVAQGHPNLVDLCSVDTQPAQTESLTVSQGLLIAESLVDSNAVQEIVARVAIAHATSDEGLCALVARAQLYMQDGLSMQDIQLRLMAESEPEKPDVPVIDLQRVRTTQSPKDRSLMTPEEHELIRRAQDFDPVAFAELYERYYNGVYKYVYHRMGDPELSQDITMEVFSKAMEAIEKFTFQGAPFSSWLYRITSNLVVDYFRRRPVEMPYSLNEELDNDNLSYSISWESVFTHQALRRALAELTDDQQQVIILKFVDGLNNYEIAQILGKTEGAVKALQHRGVQAMGRFLGEQGEVPA